MVILNCISNMKAMWARPSLKNRIAKTSIRDGFVKPSESSQIIKNVSTIPDSKAPKAE